MKVIEPKGLHPKNKHLSGYDFPKLMEVLPALKEFVAPNKYGNLSINFADSKAVKTFNRALLKSDYTINFWEFPDENLCPPIPGRVDYLHYLIDLINTDKGTILDIGTGATCIYPILGTAICNWNFVGTDIDEETLDIAEKIIQQNQLEDRIILQFQEDENHIFKGVIKENDRFLASVCNPPFYKSAEEAAGANNRKLKGLGLKNEPNKRNFSGNNNELWYVGGEKAFVHTYLYESSFFKENCCWFTTLVSNKDHLKSMYTSLKKLGATAIKTIPMVQGNKVTRVVAWSFLTEKERSDF